MKFTSHLLAMSTIYLMLLTAFIVPANAVARTSAPTGAIVNFNMMGEMLSPRSRCKDAAKRQWKRCRERDRRANARCDWELERRRRECDRLRG